MNERRRIAWVLGWAIPPEWFAPLARAVMPADKHVLFEPSPATCTELGAAGPFDWIVGYSLGSLLLLEWSGLSEHAFPADRAQPGIALLAPIWAFPREAGAGGRVPRANLRALIRTYRAQPEAALNRFYQLAGLDCRPSQVGARHANNLWGLEQLDHLAYGKLQAGRAELADCADEASGRSPARPEVALHPALALVPPVLPPGWRAWCGAADPLLDANQLQSLVPQLHVIPAATHHPAPLIAAFAASLP